MKKQPLIFVIGMAGLFSCIHSPSPQSVSSDSGVAKVKVTARALADSTGSKLTGDSGRKDPAPPAALKMVASFNANLNDDLIPDTLKLYTSTADTSVYDVLTITLAGYETKTFQTKYPWTHIDNSFEDSNLNQLPTGRLLLSRWKSQRVLLLFGTPDETGDESNFCIINIENNRVKSVLDQSKREINVEYPLRLTDLNGDGRPEFIYRIGYQYSSTEEEHEKLGGMIGAYSPFFIYTVDDSCILNKKLFMRYNKEHYVFAGFDYSEGIKILYPDDKSKPPEIWKK